MSKDQTDPRPEPSDGPEYHADLTFWESRQTKKDVTLKPEEVIAGVFANQLPTQRLWDLPHGRYFVDNCFWVLSTYGLRRERPSNDDVEPSGPNSLYPIRMNLDSPTVRIRKFAPLGESHPSVGTTCAACQVPFKAGETQTVIPLGPGNDPEEQAKAREGRYFTGVGVLVHWVCATGKTG